MFLHRWFLLISIVVALPSVAAPALARRGDERRTLNRSEDEAQMRELLAKLAAARADAEAARAESARVRQRADMTSETRTCVADASARSEPRKRRRSGAGRVHSHHAERTQIALTSTVPARADRYQARVSLPPPAPPIAAPMPKHGIIVVPLPSPSAPVVEAGRRRSTRVRWSLRAAGAVCDYCFFR